MCLSIELFPAKIAQISQSCIPRYRKVIALLFSTYNLIEFSYFRKRNQSINQCLTIVSSSRDDMTDFSSWTTTDQSTKPNRRMNNLEEKVKLSERNEIEHTCRIIANFYHIMYPVEFYINIPLGDETQGLGDL